MAGILMNSLLEIERLHKKGYIVGDYVYQPYNSQNPGKILAIYPSQIYIENKN